MDAHTVLTLIASAGLSPAGMGVAALLLGAIIAWTLTGQSTGEHADGLVFEYDRLKREREQRNR